PESLTAGLVGHALRPFRHYGLPRAAPCSPLGQSAGVVKTVCGRPTMLILRRNDEAGVLHAERAEDAPLQNGSERTAFDSSDQEPQQVRRSPVVHRASRLVDQG